MTKSQSGLTNGRNFHSPTVSDAPANSGPEDDRAIVVKAIDVLLSLDGVSYDQRRQLERIKARVETNPNRSA
jgi:hypothetical protein